MRITAESTVPEHPLPVCKWLERPEYGKVALWAWCGNQGMLSICTSLGGLTCSGMGPLARPSLLSQESALQTWAGRHSANANFWDAPCSGPQPLLVKWSSSKQVLNFHLLGSPARPAPGESSILAGVVGVSECSTTCTQWSLCPSTRGVVREFMCSTCSFKFLKGTSGSCHTQALFQNSDSKQLSYLTSKDTSHTWIGSLSQVG